ncbi:hypothetical protein SAMN06265795_102645 [Noviherbaspirillum humi]|uniref:Uncharacterized protein n=1 Tax=Noviherbaspirillum humi TaxID=1688639 RepID=A0A239EF09_9BURK|nr:hypothetical protein [Noviherbaspirillum humi]SNS42494.1 hypothetical protein SAMN06265795_102645 [Noviherbaspirillum humi]
MSLADRTSSPSNAVYITQQSKNPIITAQANANTKSCTVSSTLFDQQFSELRNKVITPEVAAHKNTEYIGKLLPEVECLIKTAEALRKSLPINEVKASRDISQKIDTLKSWSEELRAILKRKKASQQQQQGFWNFIFPK